MIRISVVICTYNRADLLQMALESLCNQDLDRYRYEIIVVDNNSTDHTRRVAESFIHHGNVRYLFDEVPGVSHARNTGWRNARGRYVSFTDDDATAPKNWLTMAETIIRDKSPDIFGGPFFPSYQCTKPAWFKDEYGTYYPYPEARPLNTNEHLIGPNFFVKRSALEESGGFKEDLGMKGDDLGYGEETDLMMRIATTVPDSLVFYHPELYVFHAVRPSKMGIVWQLRNAFINGRYFCVFQIGQGTAPENIFESLVKTLYFLLLVPADCIYGLLLRETTKYPHFFNYLYEHTMEYFRALGVSYESVMRGVKRKGPIK